jgi:anthranilate synthase component 2
MKNKIEEINSIAQTSSPLGVRGVLVLDNYDSFTYNLVHYIESFNVHCDVFRNDKISLEDVNQYDKIILSPGPGIPEEAGILLDVIKTYAPTKSILGVCLGHQAIGQVFGAELYNVGNVIHGKSKIPKLLMMIFYLTEWKKNFKADVIIHGQ